MDPFESFLLGLQDLMSQVPDILQPVIVALAGAIPFVEGELASTLGIWAGLNPIVAFLAAATGNFLSVFVVVYFGARIRESVVTRRARRARVSVNAAHGEGTLIVDDASARSPAESKGRQRFRRFLVRFGVPGASILGPLALPTQFTAAMLVTSGVRKEWVLLWQAVAIVLWTAVTTLIATGALVLLTA